MRNYKRIDLFITILIASVKAKPFIEANLCHICDDSIANTFNSSYEINKNQYNLKSLNTNDRICYKHGAYSVFCYPSPEKNSKKEDPGQDCYTYLSIMPPKASDKKCNVQILDNIGSLQDTLTIYKNLSITTTNGSWYAVPKKDTSNLHYTIVKRNPSKHKFEGKKFFLSSGNSCPSLFSRMVIVINMPLSTNVLIIKLTGKDFREKFIIDR